MSRLKVGIVGGGIAGLYAALLLQREGHCVRILEGTNHVGGRVHTHYFTSEKDQYYEAGAMRIPKSDFHKIVYQLVDYISSASHLPLHMKVNLIKYVLTSPGNDLYINGIRPGVEAYSVMPSSVNWTVPSKYSNKTAEELMREAIGPLVEDLQKDFQKGFDKMVKEFDNYTFRYYCSLVMNWPDEVIDFVETVTSQTNQFTLSVPELVMQNMDFDEKEWMTVDGGMSRLPQAMAYLVGYNNITFGARVTAIEAMDSGEVRITASGYNGSISANFDRVILAVPPAALRMIGDRPRWNVEKEVAIRSMHFEALYKMGMRFKTRFWERMKPNASKGGQSTTDLPIRWVVFPSNGIGEDGPGVLLVYAWMTDAANWLPLTPLERRSLAIHCIAEMYQGQWDDDKQINVYDLLIETSDAVWSASTATGDAMFLPGQFSLRFDVARKREGNIYFAGEHLSYHHTWISGAANSALFVVKDMLDNQSLVPLTKSDNCSPKSAARMVVSTPGINGVAPPLISASNDPDPAKVRFSFKSHNPMFLKDRWGSFQGWHPNPRNGEPRMPGYNNNSPEMEYKFPTHLGMSDESMLGAKIASLKAPNANGDVMKLRG
ncbi:MAG: hypothetical protein M1834_003015 [Cirrosporium novae-zelandiae]|nr:MAG: hypothetical protein M1834_003015 [Cirrosporium novae-zelandiae]